MIGTYRRDGWQLERGLIPSSVIDHLREFLESALDPTVDQMSELGVRVGTRHMTGDIHALLGGPNSESIDRDLRVIMTGHYPLNVRLDPMLHEIPKVPALKEFLAGILGESDLRMHMPPTARFVWPGNSDAGVPAHQDAYYNKHMSNFVTVWIPLVDIDDDCGGVTVFPGSDTELRDPEMLAHGIWFDELETADYQAIDCVPMQPGDVLVFNPLLVHKSMPNKSGHVRFSLDCRFFPGSVNSGKHYLDVNSMEVVAPDA